MKQVYGYIRVSTKEQISGASLPEQKSAIKEYAKNNHLKITHFYEESKTAAKKGRPLFLEMIKNLKSGKANGVIMHKIDRSARNLHDWASIGDLIDMNIDVYFAHESLDMTERGGRLSADIQAVMASDYVRNLRQEILKGIYGRLKQGYYPFRAPVGYDDNGRGQNKTINPVQGKFIKEVFNLYLTEQYNIIELSKEMFERGLRSKKGLKVSKNGIVKILKNHFYIGLMKVKGKTYDGNHKPIISVSQFEHTQKILKGRDKKKGYKHSYLFRKLVRCENCNLMMSGEAQKGNIYYRCRNRSCKTKCIREDTLELFIQNILKTTALNTYETKKLNDIIISEKTNNIEIQSKLLEQYNLEKNKLKDREQKIFDAYLDNLLKKEEYLNKKERILIKIKKLEEHISRISASKNTIFDNILKFVELCKNPLKTYLSAIQQERREFLEIICSNLTIKGKSAYFSMPFPFHVLANRDIFTFGDPTRDTHRILYGQIVYMNKNTSPIIPKSMNMEQIREFYNFLFSCSETLSKITEIQNRYELPSNNPNS